MQLKNLLPAGFLLPSFFDKAEKAKEHPEGHITTTNTKQAELGDVMFFRQDLDDLKRLLATIGSDAITIKELPKTDVIIVKRTASSDNSVIDDIDAAATPTISSISPTITIASTSPASSASVSDASDFSEEMSMSAEVESPTSSILPTLIGPNIPSTPLTDTTIFAEDTKTSSDEEVAVKPDLSENDIAGGYDIAPETHPVQLSTRDSKFRTPGVFPWRSKLCRCVSIGAIFGNKDDRLPEFDGLMPAYSEGISIFNWGNSVCKCVPMDDAFGDHTIALDVAIESIA
ncbi:hypothetical protein BDP55DRAFT_633381 [Colletotrichum godetiae]|uniref:Uncharacterized protein n=1 Tax=Colletotrichum godetiae TaxID=1209918 RepID=A0AAJ0ESR5_9PEZI|nr:uncharacterized protein BDP55DRAFT_633381 [Colletotrichum godetiae]KAK1674182.1 hypothetical protein BDP55DRAFT_633381 [Colletotrichum godetiae]